MKVLGVDPSSRNIGLAMMEGERLLWAGSVGLKGSLDERLAAAGRAVKEAIEGDRPEVIVQEAPGPWTRGKAGSTTHTVEVLAKVRAVIWVAVRLLDLPCYEITVNRARHLVFGKGNCKKHVVIDTLRLMGYKLPVKNLRGSRRSLDDDAADAIVVALAWQQEQRLEAMIAKSEA